MATVSKVLDLYFIDLPLDLGGNSSAAPYVATVKVGKAAYEIKNSSVDQFFMRKVKLFLQPICKMAREDREQFSNKKYKKNAENILYTISSASD